MANGIIILLVILILLLIGSVIMFAVYYRNQVNNPVCNCQEPNCNCPICPLCPTTPTNTPGVSGGTTPVLSGGSGGGGCTTIGCDNSSYCTGGAETSGAAYYMGPNAECSASGTSCSDNTTLMNEKGAPGGCAYAQTAGCTTNTKLGVPYQDFCPVTCGSCPSGAASPTPTGGSLVSCGVPGCDNSAYCSGGKVQSGFAIYEGPNAECSNPKSCVDNDTAIAAAGSKTVTSCSDVVTKDLCDYPSAAGPTLGEFCPVSCGGCPGQSKTPAMSNTFPPYVSPSMSTNPYNPSPMPTILPAPSGSCSTVGCDNSVFCTSNTSDPQASGAATFQGTQAACSAPGGTCADNDALVSKSGYTCAQLASDNACGTPTSGGPVVSQYCPVSCNTCPN